MSEELECDWCGSACVATDFADSKRALCVNCGATKQLPTVNECEQISDAVTGFAEHLGDLPPEQSPSFVMASQYADMLRQLATVTAERDEAKLFAANLQRMFDEVVDHRDRLQVERDEARADLEDYKILFGDSSIVQLREQAAAVFGMNPSNENVLRTKVTQQEGEIQVVTAERDEALAERDKLQAKNKVLTTAHEEICRVYCNWYDNGISTDAGATAYELKLYSVSALRLAAALGDTGGTGR